MGDVTIFHNPACATSRDELAMIRNSGVEPTNVNCLETPPGRAELVEIVAAMDITARAWPFAKEHGEQVNGLAELPNAFFAIAPTGTANRSSPPHFSARLRST